MGIAYDLNVSLGVDEGSDQCPSTYSSYLHLDFNLYLALSFFLFFSMVASIIAMLFTHNEIFTRPLDSTLVSSSML